MSLYVIGDLHLSYGVNKPMDVFTGWVGHEATLQQAWLARVQPTDTVVLAGDLSWGMTLQEALPDFRWVEQLPGTKIILKGNHDYWWTSLTKMNSFFAEQGFQTLRILHNNCYAYEGCGICGTRGWVNMDYGEPANAKVNAREAQRLSVSLAAAEAQNLRPIAFLHYPPIYGDHCNYEMLEVLWQHRITDCYYGHVHGSSHRYAINGVRDGVCYHLIAGDYLQFVPQLIV